MTSPWWVTGLEDEVAHDLGQAEEEYLYLLEAQRGTGPVLVFDVASRIREVRYEMRGLNQRLDEIDRLRARKSA